MKCLHRKVNKWTCFRQFANSLFCISYGSSALSGKPDNLQRIKGLQTSVFLKPRKTYAQPDKALVVHSSAITYTYLGTVYQSVVSSAWVR